MKLPASSLLAPKVIKSRKKGTQETHKNTTIIVPSAGIEAALLAPYPVLFSSQFCLELMTQGKALDLRQAADLLGRDPGAVLRVYSAVAQEFPNPANRPKRLNDCIMSLDVADLVEALQTPAFERREQVALVPFARHAHLISRYALAVAASLGLDEENASLVGLLHALGELPAALGRGPLPLDPQGLGALGAAISRLHHLPAEVAAGVTAVGRKDPASLWVALVEAAHDLAQPGYGRGENDDAGIVRGGNGF